MTTQTCVKNIGQALILGALLLLPVGCATDSKHEKPVRQRGWVGGEYRLARCHWRVFHDNEMASSALPQELKNRKAALLVTALASNTPAHLAGCREGDLILEIESNPVTNLKSFRQIIDSAEPGTTVPLKIWRAGELIEPRVTVGRETYRRQVHFEILFLPIISHIDFWPNPDFSLIALGYEKKRTRKELRSVEETYQRNCGPKNYETEYRDWLVWLAVLELSRGTIIVSQDNVVQ
jgi:hypothetical protein